MSRTAILAGLLVCLCAAAGPAPAMAGANTGEPAQKYASTGAAGTSGGAARTGEAGAAEAVAAAHTDLDKLLRALLTESSTLEAGETQALQIEVTPPAMTSASSAPPLPRGPGPDLNWLHGLKLPDIPIHWHDKLLALLRHYREDPRGRARVRGWMQRSGRYERMIRNKLSEHGLPRDLLFVAMVESGFDPQAASRAGAVGMWQFVESAAGEYGLEKNKWLDERRSPEHATEAAARYLKDLYAKLGSWPLSLAAFNMGYGALLRAVRKYNTNDFWLLSRLEAGLPYETVDYVTRVMACAIVAHNPERFGLDDLERDPPLQLASVQVPGGITFSRLASLSSLPLDSLQQWNPELLRQRVPPDVKQWSLRVPAEGSANLGRRFASLQPEAAKYSFHLLRFGERLRDIADLYGTTERKLRAFNDLADGDGVQPGSRLKVPSVAPQPQREEVEPTVVAIPRLAFSYPNRRRIFYRVKDGDRTEQIAKTFKVEPLEMRLWNAIAPDAALHQGMIVQLYVPADLDLRRMTYLEPRQVRTLVTGSREFLEYHEGLRDRVRIRYRVQPRDTLQAIANRFELSVGSICRINGFGRDRVLSAGSEIILYAKAREPLPPAKPDARQTARR